MSEANPARRAERLLRWYPKNWRNRYGEEFGELLIAEIREQPRLWRRNADVAMSGVIARLANAGFTKQATDPVARVRASLASIGCALAIFFGLGVSMWSQLAIGWQWSEPDTGATYAAMIVMSLAVFLFCILGLIAAVPIVWCVLRGVVSGRSRLVGPSFLFLASAAFLVIGSRHFGNGWPGTGGHPWPNRGLVPGGVAAFAWASTLSISSYWAHPHVLLSFPTPELIWMAASPIAMVCMVVGATKAIRRVDLPSRALRHEVRVAHVAGFVTLALLVGSCSWTIDGGPGPNNLFRTGGIDIAALVVMGLAFAITHLALQRARQAGHSLAKS